MKHQYADIISPESVEVQVRCDGRVLWVNIDGVCTLRVCQINPDQLFVLDERDKQAGPWYIHGEDFAPGIVGPFDTRDEARRHVTFQRLRGDAAVVVEDNTHIIHEDIARLLPAWKSNKITAEQDREVTEV